MLTIFSDTQVRTLSDSISTIHKHLAEIESVLAASQTVNFEGATAAKAAPVAKKAESQVKTRVSRRGRGRRALTAKQVLEIKRRLAAGEGATAISRDFKVHITTINCIKWGKTWKHVALQQPTAVTVHA
jgi:DNA invertase Pin-like site-specific DNA recombinase